MWTKTKSLFLSRILTVIMAGIFFLMLFFIPDISLLFEEYSEGNGLFGDRIFLPLCIGLYAVEVCAFTALWFLHRLLENINRDIVFDEKNTRCLRAISWACMTAGFIFGIVGLWRFIFLMPAILAVTLGLIMRVLKNVFEKAVEIKSENDFTI